MRVVGIVMVLLGALALGVQGFGYLARGRPADTSTEDGRSVAEQKTAWLSPIAGGIAVVSGLLLLTTETRRD